MPPRSGLFILWLALLIGSAAFFVWYFMRHRLKYLAEKIDIKEEKEELEENIDLQAAKRELNQDKYTMVKCQRCKNVRRRAENVPQAVQIIYPKGLCRQCAFEVTTTKK
jgi:hypothetical protein